MWHLLYIVAFAVLATLAIINLARNLMLLGTTARQQPSQPYRGGQNLSRSAGPAPHPELLDDNGDFIREPLLVMRSISVNDAREQLDALYEGTSAPTADDADDLAQD